VLARRRISDGELAYYQCYGPCAVPELVQAG
jgi:hypothetical protein